MRRAEDIDIRGCEPLADLLGIEDDGTIRACDSMAYALLGDIRDLLPDLIVAASVTEEPAVEHAVHLLGSTAQLLNRIVKAIG